MKTTKHTSLIFVLCCCVFVNLLSGSLLNTSDTERRLQLIDQELKSLPTRPPYPVGGVRGYKWSKECDKPWVEVQFRKEVQLDCLVLVPLATFKGGKIGSYGMSSKLKVILKGPDKVVFEGNVIDVFQEAHPFYLELNERDQALKVSGVRVELLSKDIKDPYLGIDEVLAFSKGLNVALDSKVVGNSDLYQNEISNYPDNLVNGQTSLGLPIAKRKNQDMKHGLIISKVLASEADYIEVLFEKESSIHEVRLFSQYSPINEMLLDQYGSGFPASFRIVSLNGKGEVLDTFHSGPFINPGRNLTCFYGSENKAAGVRLYIDEFFQKQLSKFKSFALSEIQIISDQNENLALKSRIHSKGMKAQTRRTIDQLRLDALVDGKTPKGKILDLQDWLKKLAKRNDLKIEKASLINLQGEHLAQRTFWFQIILVLFVLAIGLAVYIWYRAKERQRLSLSLVRKNIANDLHDEIGSNLASIRLMMSRFKDEKVVGTVREILDESEEALREMVWALSPQQMNLVEKLQESTARLLTEHEVDFHLESSAIWENLHIKDRQHVVFWYKEALNNIQKHAEATQVKIQLSCSEEGMLFMLIQDNGKGMNLEPFKNDYDHLARLKARALKLSGEFNVNSQPGEGCEVSLSFKSDQQR